MGKMVKGKILPPWVLFGAGIEGPSLEGVIEKFRETDICEDKPLNGLPQEMDDIYVDGTKEKRISKKISTKSSIRREIKELCRIARSINQEPSYPSGVWNIDKDTKFPEEDVYRYISEKRYSEGRTFLDKYVRHFPTSNFFKRSDQKRLINILEQIVTGKYDEQILQNIAENELYSKKLEPRFKVYVRTGYKIKEFENSILSLDGYNKKEDIILTVYIVPYIAENIDKKDKEKEKQRKKIKKRTNKRQQLPYQVPIIDAKVITGGKEKIYGGPGQQVTPPDPYRTFPKPQPYRRKR